MMFECRSKWSLSPETTFINAEILKMSQQPQPSIIVDDDPTKTLTDIEAPRVVVRLVNSGLSTARDCWYQSWVELRALPFDDLFEDYFVRHRIRLRHGWPVGGSCHLRFARQRRQSDGSLHSRTYRGRVDLAQPR